VTDVSAKRRDRRRQDMRNELADAAIRLFEERGFENVTVDEIVAAVEISQRTFFRYFESKYEVLFADHDERIAELEGLLAARPSDEPVLTAVRAALVQSGEHYRGEAGRAMQRRMAIIATSSTLSAFSLALQSDWEDAVTRHVRMRLEDDHDADTRARLIGAASLAAMRIAIANWRSRGGRESYARLIDEVFGMLDGGLNPSPKPRA